MEVFLTYENLREIAAAIGAFVDGHLLISQVLNAHGDWQDQLEMNSLHGVVNLDEVTTRGGTRAFIEIANRFAIWTELHDGEEDICRGSHVTIDGDELTARFTRQGTNYGVRIYRVQP